ncbi:MAG: DEAD/DEAH box helicase [Saccharospirillum sp.]|nr:DEAD/DEAH box helicase [Saccharospirillum sp.]
MHFTLNDIQAMADPQSFQRGLAYFKQGRVKRVIYEPDDDEFSALVSSSKRNMYTVWLNLSNQKLVGQCSCPVAFDCKHCVAAALEWQKLYAHKPVQPKTSQDLSRSHLNLWLQQIPESQSDNVHKLSYGRTYTLYFLEELQATISVQLRKAYLKKSGEWSRIERYHPDYFGLKYSPPAHIQPVDVTILQLLPPESSSAGIELEGAAGRLALNHMLATGRLFFNGKNVRSAATQGLAWRWQQTEEGYQLRPVIPGRAHWHLLDTEPPCYLDAEEGRIGELTTDIETAQLAHLRAMPAVPKEAISEVAVALRQHFNPNQLPLPVPEPRVVTANKPTPCLTLVCTTLNNQPRLPVALFHFNYEGERVEPRYQGSPQETVELRENDGQTVRIVRQFDQELDLGDALKERGLELYREVGPHDLAWLPHPDSPSRMMAFWQNFVDNSLAELEQQGWQIELDESFDLSMTHLAFDFVIEDTANHWFDFALSLPFADKGHLNTTAVVNQWLDEGTPEELVFLVEGEWVRVNTQPLHTIRDLITDLYNRKQLNKAVKLPAFQVAQLADLPNLDERKAPLTQRLRKQLQDFRGIEPVQASSRLNAELRPYQQEGLNWLVFLHRYRLGGILADDMGLGKTLQSLAMLQHLKDTKTLNKPALIIAPTSLMGNWLHEAAHFTPGLKVTLIHGPDRAPAFKQINHSDLVLTTYPLLVRDKQKYAKHRFSVVILDEAQAIKNPTTRAAQEVRALNGETRLCLTGTPLENHLGELWALMDFVLPGLLGGQKTFQQNFRTPIETHGDTEQQLQLARRVAPFMLRRTKNQVVTELPGKTEMVQYVELEGKQRALYESIRVSMEKRIRDLVASQGMARSHIDFLDALLKLRQACIDPRLVKLDKAQGIKEHAKLEWLNDNLPQLLEEGRNILIFSQFTQLLALIETDLNTQGIVYAKLTGQTRKRQEAIDRFQNGDARVFLISLKAGGSGLNLTAADVVIHMDPWWNPAVENQATDRAHRIGQDKAVFVYKLVATDTVEERIQQMQQHKQALADQLFDETGSAGLPQDKDALLALLAS